MGSSGANIVVALGRTSDELCQSAGCLGARTLLPYLVGLGAVVVVLVVARLLGPVFVTPAVGSWLLATPVDRSALLRPRLLGFLGLVSLGTGIFSAAGAGLAGFALLPVLVFTANAALLAAAAVGVAATSQARDGETSRRLTWLLGAVVWAGLAVTALGTAPEGSPRTGVVWLWWVGLAATVALVVTSGAAALVALGRLTRRQLAPGGALVPGLSGALAALDLALLYDVLLAHRWKAHPAVRPRRGGPAGLAALVWADLTRLRRSPQRAVVLAASAVLPYAAATAGAERSVVLIVALTGFLAGLPLLTALRVVDRTPSLARNLPFSTAATRATTLFVPGAVMLVFGLAVAPSLHTALGVTWAAALALALAGVVSAVAASVRWVTGRPPDYSRPLVSTPAGGIPTNLYGSVVRGFDVLLLTSAPTLLITSGGNGIGLSLILSAAVIGYLVARR